MTLDTRPDLDVDKIPGYVRRLEIQVDDESKASDGYTDNTSALISPTSHLRRD